MKVYINSVLHWYYIIITTYHIHITWYQLSGDIKNTGVEPPVVVRINFL